MTTIRSIFVTGGTGFVGRRLLARAAAGQYERVVCLARGARNEHPELLPGVDLVTGGLLRGADYQAALRGVDAVIHLAAVTGKAPPKEYFRTNLAGTRALLEACWRAGVQRFVYVSSIAAKFPDKTRYPYAQSKQQAEEFVARSGLRYTIVRPTLVLGAGSPIFAALDKLAQLPVIPVFGDGQTPVQPIDVDDLAGLLLTIAESDELDNQIIELGGPEVVSIEELLQRIRRARNRSAAPTLHLPIGIVRPMLAAAETLAYSLVPVTVGQLATFRFDGTAAANALNQQPALKSMDAMLAESVPSAGEPSDALARECRVFSRYLGGVVATPYILGKYSDAHRKRAELTPPDAFERLLVRLAARHPLLTRISDCYARLLAPSSALRKKLVLLLALLETSKASEQFLDPVDSGSKVSLSLLLLGHGLLFVISSVLGIIVLLPCRLLLGGKRTNSEPQ